MAKPKPKKRKPGVPSDVIRHGGRDLKLPRLSCPVGPESAALRARYPSMNQQTDLDVVDYYLSAIEAVKGLNAAEFPNEMAAQRLFWGGPEEHPMGGPNRGHQNPPSRSGRDHRSG